jgi:hypothetical protein
VILSTTNLLNFTLIVFGLLVTSSVGSYLVFGAQMEEYDSFLGSIITNVRLALGDGNYSAMNKANPDISAPFFYAFIFWFSYFAMNMYQAILIRTYGELRSRRLLISEAMARIFFNDF